MKSQGPRLRSDLRRVEFEFFRTVSTLIVSAFGLVAALAWNTAITKILEDYLRLKPDSGIISWFIYAVVVTILAVLATVYLGRVARRLEEKTAEQRTTGE